VSSVMNGRKPLDFYLAQTPRTVSLDNETAVAVAEVAQLLGLNEKSCIKGWALWFIRDAARAVLDCGHCGKGFCLTVREQTEEEKAAEQ
jgi:hypothetical protein